MRFVISALVLASVFVAGAAFGGDGEQIFAKLNCAICHKPDKKAAAISLKEIASAYSKDRDKLLNLFKGEAGPLIPSNNWVIMSGRLEKIKELSEQEQESLARYILSFK